MATSDNSEPSIAEVQLQATISLLNAVTLEQQNLPSRRAVEDAQLQAQLDSLNAQNVMKLSSRKLQDATITQRITQLSNDAVSFQATVDAEKAQVRPDPVQIDPSPVETPPLNAGTV